VKYILFLSYCISSLPTQIGGNWTNAQLMHPYNASTVSLNITVVRKVSYFDGPSLTIA
jgi:hypothetical protein